MKKIFKFAAIVAAAAALFSCQEKPEPTPTPDQEKPGQEQEQEKPAELNQNIKFTIELTDVTEETAKFKIKHDGVKADTWHYFATTETDVTKAIETEVAAIMADGKSLQSSTNKNVTVRGLQPETKYSLVVFGISTKGETYGQPATFEFTTTAAPIEGFQVNPAWYVEYVGEYEENGKVYENVVYVESADENTYFTTAWPKEYYDQLGIEGIVAQELQAWTEIIAQYGITWNDVIMSGPTLSQVEIDTQYGNNWYILAIGADSKGNATGYYAMSELVSFVEEDASEAYTAWLGDWTITGSNGITQNVTFSKGKANKTFVMTGYEGPDAEGLDVTVDWFEEDGIWAIYNQNLGTYNFGQYGNGDIWFLGEGEEGDIYLSEVPICMGGTFEDGSLGAVGYEETFELEDGTPMTYKVVTMEYLAYLTDHGQLSYITGTYETGYPTFPMVFTPATKASTASTKEFKGMKKSIKNINFNKGVEFQAYFTDKAFMVR